MLRLTQLHHKKITTRIFSNKILTNNHNNCYNSCNNLNNYKLLAKRSLAFEQFPKSIGLYNKNYEKDSCGVGLVAQMKKKPSRQIVLDANQMLVRMSHRGGCGCEEASGDGAGTNRLLYLLSSEFDFFISYYYC